MWSAGEPQLLGRLGGGRRALHHRLAQHGLGGQRLVAAPVLVHQGVEQLRVERAGVDADPDRASVVHRRPHHRGEVRVVAGAAAHVARVDAVLGQGLGAVRELAQQRVPVVVEVAHQRHRDAVHVAQAVADLGHPRRRGAVVDRDAHDLRAGLGQLRHLAGGRGRVGGVGVGHRLDHDGGAAADLDVADATGMADPPGHGHPVNVSREACRTPIARPGARARRPRPSAPRPGAPPPPRAGSRRCRPGSRPDRATAPRGSRCPRPGTR